MLSFDVDCATEGNCVQLSTGVKIQSIPQQELTDQRDAQMSGLLHSEPSLVTSGAWFPAPVMEQVPIAVSVAFPVSLREISAGVSLEITFPEFRGAFGGPVTVDASEIDSGRIVATARITPNLDLVMKLASDCEDGAASSTEATVEIRHRDSERRRALDGFVSNTLFALLGLSRRVDLQLHMPGIGPIVSLKFDVALPAISQYLQSRQIAYKVMVIERATHQQFTFPTTRSAVEVATISFVYEATVKRSFLWPDNYDGGQIRLPALPEALNELHGLMQGRDLKFGPQPHSRTLCGKTVYLGVGTITVLDAVIEDSDKLKAAMERGDGREIQARIRSLSGRVRYDLPDAPRITDEHWDHNTQALIDLEPQLDAALVERYNTLAAATLSGLTEGEKAQVTSRVEFGAGFLPREINGDNSLWRRLLHFLRFR